ncbi:CX domain-containing protein [Caenorhabditis elegans]|uniref:CX domain-containing protein n=1 Tax=Caenorhabditis elegans TaxID=6239 RepID=A0A3B1E647_CAEEL|nr:CX domain-containing protein [Caenorhabditis elegans]VAY52529.1 CX domain-containing protein [Caenorhabditis elegans]|eukprot:NP_001355444.1 Uncharacterized protein CELE_F43D2.7 [Caenorhabditis elegans]
MKYWVIILYFIGKFIFANSNVKCPKNSIEKELECAIKCCSSFVRYYCCGIEENEHPQKNDRYVDFKTQGMPKADRYRPNKNGCPFNFIAIGLISFIVISILFSFFCWLYRCCIPQRYDSVQYRYQQHVNS